MWHRGRKGQGLKEGRRKVKNCVWWKQESYLGGWKGPASVGDRRGAGEHNNKTVTHMYEYTITNLVIGMQTRTLIKKRTSMIFFSLKNEAEWHICDKCTRQIEKKRWHIIKMKFQESDCRLIGDWHKATVPWPAKKWCAKQALRVPFFIFLDLVIPSLYDGVMYKLLLTHRARENGEMSLEWSCY